jgi:threonine/homoserine/homoserine lactone efflux protein
MFFYAWLFPAFVDVGHATVGQFAAELLLTALAVGVPKLPYAKLASSAVLRSRLDRYSVQIRQVAGMGVLGTGALVIVKTP